MNNTVLFLYYCAGRVGCGAETLQALVAFLVLAGLALGALALGALGLVALGLVALGLAVLGALLLGALGLAAFCSVRGGQGGRVR